MPITRNQIVKDQRLTGTSRRPEAYPSRRAIRRGWFARGANSFYGKSPSRVQQNRKKNFPLISQGERVNLSLPTPPVNAGSGRILRRNKRGESRHLRCHKSYRTWISRQGVIGEMESGVGSREWGVGSGAGERARIRAACGGSAFGFQLSASFSCSDERKPCRDLRESRYSEQGIGSRE
jgi:hypothetical protein